MKSFFIASLLLVTLAVSGQTPRFQGTIKPGSQPNNAIVALRPNVNYSGQPQNFSIVIAVPQTVGTRPVMSIVTNNYTSFFTPTGINIFQTATYLTDYIYWINFAPSALQTKSYNATSDDVVVEVSFTENVNASTDIRLVNLPLGLATGGAGGENGNYNFYIDFNDPVNGPDMTNTSAMFYTTTGGTLVNNPLGYDGYSFVSRGSNPVPVTWVDFNVTRSLPDALLNWRVANQVNNDRFEVEVSKDGSRFSYLGKVAATSSDEYQYIHKDIDRWNVPVLYYRIKQVDKDGRFDYSVVKKLQLDNKALSISIAENPVKGSTVNAFIHAVTQGRGTLMVADLTGKIVYQKQTEWTAGTSAFSLDLGNLASGGYVLSLVSDAERLQLQFIK